METKKRTQLKRKKRKERRKETEGKNFKDWEKKIMKSGAGGEMNKNEEEEEGIN